MLVVTYEQVSNGLKAMQSFREKLPAFKMKSEFLKAVSENQVQYFAHFHLKFSFLSRTYAS